jgi:iron complex outermembrane receptor protein
MHRSTALTATFSTATIPLAGAIASARRLGLTIAGLGMLSSQVLAQGGGLEEIIVTAQKRAESLQEVPLSVAAVTGAAIERANITSIQGIKVPNVQIDNFTNTPNGAVMSIRGIGVVEPDPYAGNTVGIMLDGVPQLFNMTSLLDLFDIERVEVLRGPQGTLFGANTTGGVINVITEQPTGEWGGKARATLGNWDRRDLSAAVNFPLIPNLLAGKVTVQHHERDGWVKNIVDGSDMNYQDTQAIRGSLLWTPAADLDITWTHEFVQREYGPPVVVNGSSPGEATYVPEGVAGMYANPCPDFNDRCVAPGRYLAASQVRDIGELKTYANTLTFNWSDTALGDLVSITGYKQFRVREDTDQDGSPLFLDDTERETEGWQFTQELRSSFAVSDSWDMTAGAFFTATHYEHLQNFRINFPGLEGAGLRQENPQEQDSWSASLFAQSYYQLTDRLRLQAGLRYTHEATEMDAGIDFFAGSTGFNDGVLLPPPSTFAVEDDDVWDNVGGKIGLDYQLAETVMLYTSYARGFKSGGFVGRVGIPQDIGPYDPEYVDTFEVGMKGDFLDNRLRSNLTLFHSSYEDMQLAQIYFIGAIQGNSILNAGKSEIQGAEMELTLVPVDGLTLNLNLGYLDSEFKKFAPPDPVTGLPRDFSGFRLQNTPEWTGSANAAYEFPLAAGTARAYVEFTHSADKYLTSLDNSPRTVVQEMNLVNASVEWSPQSDAWTLSLWGRNLADKRYIASAFEAPGTIRFVNYAPPREFGVTLNYRW